MSERTHAEHMASAGVLRQYLRDGTVRLVLGVALLVMVWREAGTWTALTITLLCIGHEATGLCIALMRDDRTAHERIASILRGISAAGQQEGP